MNSPMSRSSYVAEADEVLAAVRRGRASTTAVNPYCGVVVTNGKP
jgi:hypothetical protein